MIRPRPRIRSLRVLIFLPGRAVDARGILPGIAGRAARIRLARPPLPRTLRVAPPDMDTLDVEGATLRLVRGDITDQDVDAVVNAANSSLMGGGGVDGAIHRSGGSSIKDACRRIRNDEYPDGLPTGKAVTTTAGDLPAHRVIHTVGPRWKGGDGDEEHLLANAYRNSIGEARAGDLRTVAFPSISTGAYGYPIREAAAVALRTVIEDLEAHPGVLDEVRFVLFSEDDLAAYRSALDEVAAA